jgi:hypothetical protein
MFFKTNVRDLSMANEYKLIGEYHPSIVIGDWVRCETKKRIENLAKSLESVVQTIKALAKYRPKYFFMEGTGEVYIPKDHLNNVNLCELIYSPAAGENGAEIIYLDSENFQGPNYNTEYDKKCAAIHELEIKCAGVPLGIPKPYRGFLHELKSRAFHNWREKCWVELMERYGSGLVLVGAGHINTLSKKLKAKGHSVEVLFSAENGQPTLTLEHARILRQILNRVKDIKRAEILSLESIVDIIEQGKVDAFVARLP